MAIKWREKIVAAAIHFLITLLVAGLAAAIIFMVWFPGAMATMVGGAKLFFIVVASDLVLGPLMSLVIYSSKKSRRELIIDYVVIGAVQLAALVYGVLIVAGSRPVFVAFNRDRLEVVTAIELEDADLATGTEPQYRSKSWFGPRLVYIVRPADVKERSELLFSSLNGKDSQLMPKYYRDYDAARDLIVAQGQSIESLLHNSGSAKPQIEAAVAAIGKPATELRWLLAHHRFGFAVAFIDASSGVPVKYLAIDPVWLDETKPANAPADSKPAN